MSRESVVFACYFGVLILLWIWICISNIYICICNTDLTMRSVGSHLTSLSSVLHFFSAQSSCRVGRFDVSFVLPSLFLFFDEEWQRDYNFTCTYYLYIQVTIFIITARLRRGLKRTKINSSTSCVESFSLTH